MRLFVYGTLCDPRQFARVADVEDPRGIVVELKGYQRLPFGAIAYYPTIIPDEESSVAGVVYDITDRELHNLDVYEGFPNLYRRDVVFLDDDDEAFVYVQNDRWTA